MQQKVTFSAQPRSILGKKVKTIRQGSDMPANIIGNVEKPMPVTVNRMNFTRLYDKVGDTGLVYLKVDDEAKERPVLVDDVQFDPVNNQLLHVVFRQVNLNEKVSAEVPVEIVGELTIKDVIVVTVHDEVTVSALPQDLPEKFIVDISKFTEVGQSVTFEQLEYDRAKVTLEVPAEQLSTPVVMVQEVKEEVAEPVVAATPAEGEAAAASGAAAETPADAKPAAEKKEEKK